MTNVPGRITTMTNGIILKFSRVKSRSRTFTISDRLAAGIRRYGRSLSRRGQPAPAKSRTEIFNRRCEVEPGSPRTLSSRSPGRIGAESSEHLHDLRDQFAGRDAVHRDGIYRRRNRLRDDPQAPAQCEAIARDR